MTTDVCPLREMGRRESMRRPVRTMRTIPTWLFLSLLSLAAGGKHARVAVPPPAPPAQRVLPMTLDRVVTLDVEYDETFLEQHGEAVEDFIREVVAIHNLEWRRYRRDWFELGRLTFRPSGSELDASYVLAKFLHRTSEAADTIHVNIVGRALEVYTSGTRAIPVGGLAYRGSDAVVISAIPGVSAELLAYYLFHELGHCWDAHDIPFHGGDTTYGSKTRMTFEIDAGNEQIMEDSPGPLARGTPQRAPMLIREKLFRAYSAARDTTVAALLYDLLLHEPSPANPAYVAKKRALLASAGKDRGRVAGILQTYEITPQEARHDADVRHRIADHYWRANDAIRRRDYDAADAELQTIRTMAAASPGEHMLVGAVERKVRRRR